jgi:hypothetical protein
MSLIIVKLADDKFVEWSTAWDKPSGRVVSRSEAVDEWGEDRVARADEHWVSLIPKQLWCSTPEEAVSCNRAGEDETELTVDEIVERYSA